MKDTKTPGKEQLDEMLEKEKALLLQKRKKMFPDSDTAKAPELFGIALSGGGIRSATINLGFLHVLNKCGLLRAADYLSTVSGGGYTGAYVQTTLKKNSAVDPTGSYSALFRSEDIDEIRNGGNYLTPGFGIRKKFNTVKLAATYVTGFVLNLVWLSLFAYSVLLVLKIGLSWFVREPLLILSSVTVIVLSYHFLFHLARNWKIFKLPLWSSNILGSIETVLFIFWILYYLYTLSSDTSMLQPLLNVVTQLAEVFNFFGSIATALGSLSSAFAPPYSDLILAIGLLILTGFFANPNLLGFHRFYRDKLAAVYMKSAGNGDKALKVRELVDHEGKMNSPYPLINTCLNLFGKNEDQYRGMKTEDYFLFSPLYSGAKLTGYVDTTDRRFRNITVSTATAISGAAFNSVMGRKTNKIASFALTVLNARTGYWAYNPKKEYRAGLSLIDWWPAYHLRELFGDTDTDRRRVNLSDGGHIENLAVYELLRRRCKLIVAVDASADPGFKFDDLNNLVIRSSNELGLCITFRQKPEDLIKPDASNGFSESQFVIGDITALPGNEECASYHGILVYVKSSMLPQRRWIDREQTTRKGKEMESYLYKTYHPKFPHESTADQFFDSDQWNAYYYLGKFMAAYVLGIELPEHDDLNDVELPISFTGSSADAIIEQLMRTVERARR